MIRRRGHPTPGALRRWLVLLVVLTLAVGACDPYADAPPTSPTATVTGEHTPTPTPPEGRRSPTSSPTPTPDAAPDPRALPRDPGRLARILTRAERLVRRAGLADDRLSRWAHVQQATYRLLSRHPALRQPVRAGLPADLRRAFDLNLRATIELRRLTEPRDELPDWRIVAPPPPEVLLDAYRESAHEFGLDWTYLAAIHLVETRMGRIRGTSRAGARGPMQFLPSTWEAYGEGDIDDAHDAIRAAARYLAAHGAPGDMEGALYAYNRSQRYVQAISDHAAVMRAEPVTYRAYHQWRVYYRLASGERILEEGWSRR